MIIPEFILPQTIPSELKELCDDNFYEFKTIEDFKEDGVFVEALNKIKLSVKNNANSST